MINIHKCSVCPWKQGVFSHFDCGFVNETFSYSSFHFIRNRGTRRTRILLRLRTQWGSFPSYNQSHFPKTKCPSPRWYSHSHLPQRWPSGCWQSHPWLLRVPPQRPSLHLRALQATWMCPESSLAQRERGHNPPWSIGVPVYWLPYAAWVGNTQNTSWRQECAPSQFIVKGSDSRDWECAAGREEAHYKCPFSGWSLCLCVT